MNSKIQNRELRAHWVKHSIDTVEERRPRAIQESIFEHSFTDHAMLSGGPSYYAKPQRKKSRDYLELMQRLFIRRQKTNVPKTSHGMNPDQREQRELIKL